MSRVQKFGNRNIKAGAGKAEYEAAAAGEWLDAPQKLPSRRHKHPSNKQQMTKWFYRLLILLFLALLIGLLMWGRRHAGL
jgi:hypothetical protein